VISVLVPSRGRPQIFARMCASLIKTAHNPVEIMVGLDRDDPKCGNYPLPYSAKALVDEEDGLMALSSWFNFLAAASTGDVLMLANDDLVFRTPGWDTRIYEALPSDGIGVLYPDDLYEHRCTFPLMSRKHYETLGYIAPPTLAHWYIDPWIADVAKRVGRLIYLDGVIVEHMHPLAGKAEVDATYRLTSVQSMKLDKARYDDGRIERDIDATTLRHVIEGGSE